MKIRYTYKRYIAEPSGGEIFLMQKFKTRIIFTAKISQPTVLRLTNYSLIQSWKPGKVYVVLAID